MKEGLAGMETSLGSTADQVDKVSGLSYPIVTFNGLKPNVEMKPFWPDADKVADGLRKATKGVQAANQELDLMDKSMPDLRKAVAESRKSVAQTRESLAVALKQQAETEKLLKAVPEQTAALAESAAEDRADAPANAPGDEEAPRARGRPAGGPDDPGRSR